MKLLNGREKQRICTKRTPEGKPKEYSSRISCGCHESSRTKRESIFHTLLTSEEDYMQALHSSTLRGKIVQEAYLSFQKRKLLDKVDWHG